MDFEYSYAARRWSMNLSKFMGEVVLSGRARLRRADGEGPRTAGSSPVLGTARPRPRNAVC